jgi:hypothetical protein
MPKHRDRPNWGLTLSPEAVAAADEMADMRGWTRSRLVEHLITEEAFRLRLNPDELGRKLRKSRGLGKRKTLKEKQEELRQAREEAAAKPARKRPR